MLPLLGLAVSAIPSLIESFGKKSIKDAIIDTAKDVTGISNIDDAVKAITGNSEKAKAFQEALIARETELIKIANADVADARNMQVEALKQDDKFSKRFVYFFALIWSVFSMVFIVCITFMHIPEPNQRFADTILGFLLATAMGAILQFFFGSSHGSKQKTEAMMRK